MRVTRLFLAGYTLIELLMVMLLLGVIASMAPLGLSKLYARSSHQLLVQQTVDAVHHCAIAAQQAQRSVRLGSPACPVPAQAKHGQMPWFHADGTASHRAYLVVAGGTKNDTMIEIDRLTVAVSIRVNAQTQ